MKEALTTKFVETTRKIGHLTGGVISYLPHVFEFRDRQEEERQDEIVRALTSTGVAAGDPEPPLDGESGIDDVGARLLGIETVVFPRSGVSDPGPQSVGDGRRPKAPTA